MGTQNTQSCDNTNEQTWVCRVVQTIFLDIQNRLGLNQSVTDGRTNIQTEGIAIAMAASTVKPSVLHCRHMRLVTSSAPKATRRRHPFKDSTECKLAMQSTCNWAIVLNSSMQYKHTLCHDGLTAWRTASHFWICLADTILVKIQYYRAKTTKVVITSTRAEQIPRSEITLTYSTRDMVTVSRTCVGLH